MVGGEYSTRTVVGLDVHEPELDVKLLLQVRHGEAEQVVRSKWRWRHLDEIFGTVGVEKKGSLVQFG